MGEKNVLTVDVGNTTTRFGLFLRGRAHGNREITTAERLTVDERRGCSSPRRRLDGPAPHEDAIVSCVVPHARGRLAVRSPSPAGAARSWWGPASRPASRCATTTPSEVGPDRVADVVAVREAYGAPVVAVDLGTTTNFEVVDAEGAFVGGIIAPGVELGARALSEAARAPAHDRPSGPHLRHWQKHARRDDVWGGPG